MATISENLQILKNSTDAIKQAIINKGGTINGDITTWASAISNIQSNNTEEEITFTGTLESIWGMQSVAGNLNKLPDDCLGTYCVYIIVHHTTSGFNYPYPKEYNAPNLYISEDFSYNSGELEDIVIIAIILTWQDSSGVWKSTLVKPIIEYSDEILGGGAA